MKKESFFYGIVFLLLVIPIASFLNLSFFSRHLMSSFSFWNINLLIFFELAIILLGLVWILYSKMISRILKLDFKETLKKDLFTYLPLFFLFFYYINLNSYTDGAFSTPVLLAAILLLILFFKAAIILHGKNKINHAYLLGLVGMIFPLIVINYFILKLYYKPTINTEQHIASGPEGIIEGIKKQYRADPLSLFRKKLEGVYKRKIKIAGETRNSLVLLPSKRIETTVKIPSESSLRFGIGILEDSYTGKGDGVQFNLFFKNNGKTKLVFAKYIDPKHYNEDQRWFDVNLDLKDYTNQKVSIIFEALGSPELRPPFERKPDNRDDYAVISDPQIIHSNSEKDKKQYNVIFISIDTLRADHLGCYGYKRKDISPYIDKLARDGILFENTISQSPWTTPSHMSMFTSLLPSYHRVLKTGSTGLIATAERLSDDKITLPEIFKAKGYATAAFAGGGNMSGMFGFSKGFDVFKEDDKDLTSFATESSFYEISKWLEANKDKNIFLFLHTFRVHAPYNNLKYASEVMTDYEIEALKRNFRKTPHDIGIGYLQKLGLYRKEIVENLYDGCINETDQYIGKLREKLEALGLSDNTIIVLTSDHGEEFADHDKQILVSGHGHSLYEELVRVPLIWVIPGDFPKRKRIKSQVRLIDIMPTLLDLCGIKYDTNKMQGTSLLPFIKGDKENKDLPAISEALITEEKKSIRTNQYKYVYTINPDNGIIPEGWHLLETTRIKITDRPIKEELYDLVNDPKEKYNLVTYESMLSKKLKNEINNALREATKIKPDSKNNKMVIDKKMTKKLKALGYIQ